MKRMLSIGLVLAMLLSLAACGDISTADDRIPTSEETTTTTTAETTTTTNATTATTTTVPTTSATTTAAPTTTTTEAEDGWGNWEDPIPPATTEEPTTTTTLVDTRPQIKILSIGHSFTVDAMRAYMWDLFEAAGYKVTLGYLYYPSCSIEQHWHYVTENRKVYEQYCKNENGRWETQSSVAALTALWDEDWDIVTFQPDPDFGYDKDIGYEKFTCKWGCTEKVESDYAHFDQLVDYVLGVLASSNNPHGPNTDVKVHYYLTWAYRQDCWLGNYLYPNCYDQLTLYQDYIAATEKWVLPNSKVQGVIPCGTAIQNVRTSYMGDNFNSTSKNDGYHLNDEGDFVAALTWVCYFTGRQAKSIDYMYGYRGTQYAAMAEAVDNAIARPWQVTESTYKTAP